MKSIIEDCLFVWSVGAADRVPVVPAERADGGLGVGAALARGASFGLAGSQQPFFRAPVRCEGVVLSLPRRLPEHLLSLHLPLLWIARTRQNQAGGSPYGTREATHPKVYSSGDLCDTGYNLVFMGGHTRQLRSNFRSPKHPLRY